MSEQDAVQKLKEACAMAYAQPDAAKSCSHAVWHVIKALVDPDFKWRNANDLVRFMTNETSGWYEVDMAKAHELANKGIVVVGGAAATGNGHVVVVYPGNMIPRGGYDYTKDGKVTKVVVKGLYPRVMSRSIGSWPGAVSLGEKTVWDPWGSDGAFAKVKFWTPLK